MKLESCTPGTHLSLKVTFQSCVISFCLDVVGRQIVLRACHGPVAKGELGQFEVPVTLKG